MIEKRRISEKMVAGLNPPSSGQLEYFDTDVPWLMLSIGYGGTKSWLVRYYRHRKNKKGKRISAPTTYKLGTYPALKVKEAREKARKFHRDPEQAKANADTNSFTAVAEEYLKRHVEREKLRTKKEIENALKKHVYSARLADGNNKWEDTQFREIKRLDVARLLDRIQDNSGPRQADKVLSIIRKMMNWYSTRDDTYQSPIVQGMGRYKAKDRARDRILNDDEIRALWQACDGTFGALLKTLLLTAQRKSKVTNMRWGDIVDGEWRIATEAREKTNAKSLRLPQLALDVINAQPKIMGNPFVFAGRNGPFNNFPARTDALNDEIRIEPWVIHDLRRTARSLLSRAGVRPDIAERVLGHAIRGVEGVYNRHDYDNEKADALARLAALVETIINPPADNVVTLTKQKRKAVRQ